MTKRSRAKSNTAHPYRVALAGGWGDHNLVNFLADGYVVVVQVKPTVTFHDRCGICSSTRKILMSKYPKGIPAHVDRYQLASELYYWENLSGRELGGYGRRLDRNALRVHWHHRPQGAGIHPVHG